MALGSAIGLISGTTGLKSVTVTPEFMSGYSRGFGTVLTRTSTSTTLKNIPNVTSYAWEFVGGDNRVFATAPSNATTKFAVNLQQSELVDATFRLKVVAGGVSYYSNNVQVSLEAFINNNQSNDGLVIYE